MLANDARNSVHRVWRYEVSHLGHAPGGWYNEAAQRVLQVRRAVLDMRGSYRCGKRHRLPLTKGYGNCSCTTL